MQSAHCLHSDSVRKPKEWTSSHLIIVVYYCTGIVGTLSWLFVLYIKLPDTQRYPELSFKK